MKKIFCSIRFYDDNVLFVYTVNKWPYKYKTNNILIYKDGELTLDDNPKVEAYLLEREEVQSRLTQEIVDIAAQNGLTIVDTSLMLVPITDSKALEDALVANGWAKEYIEIGP
jgi:hypothetical protein